MLMDHSNPEIDCIIWRSNGDGLSVDEDLPLVWMIHTVQDFHQSAFACAVLTQKSMDLVATNIEVNTVAGKHTGEALGNASHFQRFDPGLSRREFVRIGHRAILRL